MQTKTLNWNLEVKNSKITVRLKGVLLRDTLLPLWQQRSSFLSFQSRPEQLEWDLSEIESVDSAGFAFLCDCLNKIGQVNEINVVIMNPPAQLLKLADLFGLSIWLNKFIKN
ncbi:lipid asymmetry maintenance protein MlaB [Rodentibacter caecimuris]|uniref:STAS domain-containing protein n=1 Tax=Rodentibacter caecimuris TaxID=1796644 RepID=A0ABX3KZ19_9PAST|nr:hypothetical protein BKG89_03510 [Rodentibacter heylii]